MEIVKFDVGSESLVYSIVPVAPPEPTLMSIPDGAPDVTPSFVSKSYEVPKSPLETLNV